MEIQYPKTEQDLNIKGFLNQIKTKSDLVINYFLATYFIVGLVLAFYYDTWLIAVGVGGLSLVAYYSAKIMLPDSNLYQYVLSVIMGIFMAQFIYQMHGLFEMHFFAFIGSAILITYQNWKLQIPLALVVVIHHATFGYLQFIGYDNLYFTQLDYMSLRTFVIHGILATTIFTLCGFWAYDLRKFSNSHITKSFEIGKLHEAEKQKETLIAMSENLKEINDKLQRQNEELKKTNKELDSFVYSASHDLRAPITSMLGLINLMELNNPSPHQMEFISRMNKTLAKQDAFISNIIDHSRNSRLTIQNDRIDFEAEISEAIENLRFLSGGEKIAFDILVEGEAPFYCDKNRIQIMLNNLISNAIKYHNPQREYPYIKVHTLVSEAKAIISIEDNGVGIAPEHHERLFDMFYRASEKSVGSGIGLYIVKETLDKLNARIEMKSLLHEGSIFTVELPNSRLEPQVIFDKNPIIS